LQREISQPVETVLHGNFQRLIELSENAVGHVFATRSAFALFSCV
jgi:hypothetical protein